MNEFDLMAEHDFGQASHFENRDPLATITTAQKLADREIGV